MKTLRPYNEFFKKEKFSVPHLTEVPGRLKLNVIYYQTNYLLVFFVLCAYSALTSPRFLISLGFIAALWIYTLKWRDHPLQFRDREIPEKFVTVALLLLTLLLIYLSSAGSVLWWLIMVTGSFVLCHAFFYTPEPVDEFGFDSGTGFASVV